MHVALLNLSEQYRSLESEIRAQIEAIFASDHFILGPNGAAFEKADRHLLRRAARDRRFIRNRRAAGCANDAGDRPTRRGDHERLQLFATAACIARIGPTPIFVDINPATLNLSPTALKPYIDDRCQSDARGELRDENGRRMRAIMLVDLFGLCCDMDPIHVIWDKYNLDVIEDAAQAIGAEYLTAHAGLGDAGCFSFYPSKKPRGRWRCPA
jgi:dTDP-4-amino-4,6-dideoxygalactose transaminase